MRKQYHFQPSEKGFYAWDVDRLIEASKDIPVVPVQLSEIRELDEDFWYYTGEKPTCRSVADHMRLVEETDLAYPIILSARGRVMDGMHRVVKAYMKGRETIQAVRFETTPEPDFTDVFPDDLPY